MLDVKPGAEKARFIRHLVSCHQDRITRLSSLWTKFLEGTDALWNQQPQHYRCGMIRHDLS